MRKAGMALAWSETPGRFVRHRLYVGETHFDAGPVRRLCIEIRFEPRGDAATRVHLAIGGDLAAGPAGWLGWFILRTAFRGTERAMREVAARVAEGRVIDPLSPAPPGGDPQVLERMRLALAAIASDDDEDRRILERLAAQTAGACDSEAARMKPYALARAWGTEPRRTLGLCLRAAMAGALVLQWDLVCPECRRPPARKHELSDLRGEQYCETCAVTFGVELDHNVEVTFRPSPTVRGVDDHVFCFADPARQTHVAAQAIVEPGGVWEEELALEPGLHRLLARRAGGAIALDARPDGPAELALEFDPARLPGEPVAVRSGTARLRVAWRGAQKRLLVVEQAAWLADVARAAEVTAMQAFRTLFPREAVSAGERIEVRRLGFLFTDLKDSTALYERVGDGPAYGAVSEHFRVLEAAIAAEAGGVVKTIGDAVMAVFPDAASAARAAVRAQRDLAAWNRARGGREPLVVKLGLHEGPCVAVVANGVLDYFGSTVNIAARVQALSHGGDIVLSASTAKAAAVAEALAGLPEERFLAALKGLGEALEVVRVTVPPTPEDS
jgi:class 3 adenylate cyclase